MGPKKQGVTNVVDGLSFGDELSQQGADIVVRNPVTGIEQVQPQRKPQQGLSTKASSSIDSAWNNFNNSPKIPVDLARKGMQQNFNADLNHTQYERYYNHPSFKELGFSPWRDNESHYNELSSGWDDFRRTFAQWRSLASTGFWDAMSFGPTSDRKAAEKFERAMAIGQSTRGGATGFTTNLFLNSGYTFGIIAEMLVEEALLYGVGLFTGGSTWGLATARAGAKVNMLDNAWDLTKTVKAGQRTAEVLDDLKDINKARLYWERAKNVGKWAGRKIAPDTAGVIKHWDEIKELGNLAKVNTTAASFYKDIRNIRLAYGESALEAGMVENELLEEFYQAAMDQNGGRPLTDAQRNDISKRAKDASMTTFSWNLPAIWLSNQIVFDNLFHSFSPTRRLLQQPLKSNVAGRVIKEAGKHANPYQVLEGGAKTFFKAFTKPRSYAKFGLNYFRANFAEGLQETTQEIISGASKDYYRQDPNDPMLQGFHAMLSSNMKKQLTPEGLEVFMSGFFMGGPVSMVTGTFAKAADQVQKFRDPDYKAKVLKAKEDLINTAAEYNEFHADPMHYFEHNLENATDQRKYREGMERAKNQGDKKTFYDLRNAAETTHVLNAIQNGMLGGFIERMQDYATMSNEEIAEAFPNLKENPEKYKSKVDRMIKIAKTLEQDYKNYTSKMPAPTHPSAFKGNKVKYAAAAIKYKGWENSMRQFLFMRRSFYDNFERKNGILQTAGNELQGETLSGSDFVGLFDMEKTEILIQQKKQNLENLGDIKNITEEGQERNEAEALRDKTKAELDALQKFDNARSKYNSTSSAPEYAQAREDAAQEWYNAYSELIGVMSQDVQFTEDIGESFQQLLDYTDLGTESQKLKEAINFLLDPEQWNIHLERNEEAVRIGLENREPFMKELLNNYLDQMVKNKLLKTLFEEAGVFLDPEGIQALEDGSFPKAFYNTLAPYGEVYKGSSKWNTAKRIIEDYIKNVKDKPIPEAEGTSEYDVSTRDKLPGDERTYEDLAKQFGFDPKKPKTDVSLKIVLKAIIESEYATEAEKLLAEQYLEIAEDDANVTFVNNLSHPGHAGSTGVFIDARYMASDYENGGQPMEVILLHEETHRVTVNGLDTDSQYKGKITELMDIARKHFDDTRKGLPLYGFKNEAEFVAEAMSNPVFQQLLSEIPVEGPLQKNAWTMFVDAVVEFLQSTFGKNNVDGSVLNAAMEIITAKIDSDFGGSIKGHKKGAKITSQTPIDQMSPELQRDLLYAFDEMNETADVLKNRKDMEDTQVLQSHKFKNWVKANPPIVQRIITKHNKLDVAEETKEPVKSKLRYRGENPTADVLLTRIVDGETQVLLVKRKDGAVEGNKWALPGGFVDTDAKPGRKWKKGKETHEEASVRELKEETGIDLTGYERDDYSLGSLGIRDAQGRDPRNTEESWTASYLFGMKVPEGMNTDDIVGQDDASDAKWFTAEMLNNMAEEEFAFDHAEILRNNRLRKTAEPGVAKLEVGTLVKVGTKKDGQATIVEDRGDKVLLDDGRQVAKKNLTPVTQEGKQGELDFGEQPPLPPETPDHITPDMRDMLEGLGYNRFDIRKMTPAEALDIIGEGLTKEAADAKIEEGLAEARRKEAAERHDIRKDFEEMLEDAETFEDIENVKNRAKEILSDAALANVSGYDAQELANLIEARKLELAEHVNFDALERGSMIFMYDNPNAKFVVVKRTPNTVKLRKFGDELGPVFTVTRSKASEKIKYMSNEFLSDVELVEKEATPEEKTIIKEDVQNAKKLTDDVAIEEDVNNAESKSDDEIDDDLRDALDENCE
jgi:ADP-ribose pyrophosphatase YjhB (NUDIX family)